MLAAAAAAAALLAAAPGSPAIAQTAPPGGGGFEDVPEDAYYWLPVSTLTESGIFVGTLCEDGFCPSAPIDRKTMAVWTVRVLDGDDPPAVSETRFDDVDADGFHAPFIERMAELGVTTGCGDGSGFCPDRNVTRAQMAVFLSRAYNLPEGPDPGFSDVPGDAWYADDVARLAASGITIGCGDSTVYCPSRDTTRAQMATFLARAAGLVDTPHQPTVARTYRAVTAGQLHSCALRTDDTITCWGAVGDWDRGQTDAPAGTYRDVTAGGLHTCALRTDDTITCWGAAGWDRGQTDAPAGTHRDVTAGGSHTCAIRTDDTIACWGDNRHGQTDAPAGTYRDVTAGGSHTCALRTDDTIACWGDNRVGQTDAPAGTYRDVAAGGSHSCAIRTDDTIACWGYKPPADLDASAGTYEATYSAIATGKFHTCAIRADDTVTCWGGVRSKPRRAPRGHFAGVSAGGAYSCGLHTDGAITCWGENEMRQLEVPEVQRADPLWVHLSSASAPVIDVGVPFEVAVKFERAVDGLDAEDFEVVNGELTAVSGSGSEYRATVLPAAPGTVVVRIARDAVQGREGNSSAASQPLTRTATTGEPARRPGIDTWNRDAVLAAYTAEFDRLEPDWGYTGDVDNCVAGTTSQAFRDSAIQRVNWYRQMAGLGTVTEDAALSESAQQAALMMHAEGKLSHGPPSDWACYSPEGAAAAGRSNLNSGTLFHDSVEESGTGAIDGYMRDSGRNNRSVGHRRWILEPRTLTMGVGYARRLGPNHADVANALDVIGGSRLARPNVREQRGFVAWPPPGFVPPEVNWSRWSFELAGADFSAASVEVVDDYGQLSAKVVSASFDSAIVWRIDGVSDSQLLAQPANGDHCYTVTIRGVRINGTNQTPYEYAVCILDYDS